MTPIFCLSNMLFFQVLDANIIEKFFTTNIQATLFPVDIVESAI